MKTTIKNHQEPSRQIHMDFHTSEYLPGIGSQFNKEQFQNALRIGKVNLMNIFAKCHHSWSYYPTKVGKPHPNLTIDLLGSMIEACHEIGVKAPIYYTVGWSANDAEDHPDWVMRMENGEFAACETPWNSSAGPNDPKPTFQWKEMCVTGEYHELMMAQTEEICLSYDVDGMWYDIYHPQQPCYCDRCRKGMMDQGYDVNDPLQAEEYRVKSILHHTSELKKLTAKYHPEASIYFNGLTALNRPQNLKYRLFQNNSKNDLEDLPTTWGGYDKFPLRSKVFHKENKAIVAMSGKFHTAWGEFGGFKDPEALRFEAASMIAFGSRCNFGDQLHPSGIMDMTTYNNIGHAYDYVEKIEDYGINGLPESTLGIWLANELTADEGLCRMLLEEQLDFDVVRHGDPLEKFETIIIPSKAGIIGGSEAAIEEYIAKGGKILFLGEGLLNAEKTGTAIPCGADYRTFSNFGMDYTNAGQSLLKEQRGPFISSLKNRVTNLPSTPFLNYSSAIQFSLDKDSEKLASVHEPYFNRTYGQYCGHQNTPNKLNEADYPAAWKSGNIIALAHNLDRMYYQNGAKVHRSYFINALRQAHTLPMIDVAMPSAGRVNLLHQRDKNRYVAHLLYGAPIARGNCSVIEDLPELRDIELILRLPVNIKSMRLIPHEQIVDFEVLSEEAGKYSSYKIIIPYFSAHCAIVAEY